MIHFHFLIIKRVHRARFEPKTRQFCTLLSCWQISTKRFVQKQNEAPESSAEMASDCWALPPTGSCSPSSCSSFPSSADGKARAATRTSADRDLHRANSLFTGRRRRVPLSMSFSTVAMILLGARAFDSLLAQELAHQAETDGGAVKSSDPLSPTSVHMNNGLVRWPQGAASWKELGDLFTNAGPGIGIVLGLGPDANWARQFLHLWTNGVLYLCDPFIHIFRGYDDPEYNVDDKAHQINFENIRVTLMQDPGIQGRYSMVREFSFSFYRLWLKQDPRYDFGSIPPRFVFVDNNPGKEAVLRDMEDWWELLLPGGVMSGARPDHPGVVAAVEEFARRKGLSEPMAIPDMMLGPGWFLIKPNDDAANEEYIRKAEERKRIAEIELAKENITLADNGGSTGGGM